MKFVYYCRCCQSKDVSGNGAILSPFVAHRMFGLPPVATTNLYGVPNQTNYFPCLSLRCKMCDFTGVNILFSDEEMKNLYSDYRGEEYNRLRVQYEPHYDPKGFDDPHPYVPEVEDFIRKHTDGNLKRLIDYGGGDGKNTPQVAEKVYNYDIDDTKNKVSILFNCDIVTCMEVLEHVADPQAVVRHVAGVGARYSYFDVPNCDNSVRREFWHEHINCFSEECLHTLLSQHFKRVLVEPSLTHGVLKAMCSN